MPRPRRRPAPPTAQRPCLVCLNRPPNGPNGRVQAPGPAAAGSGVGGGRAVHAWSQGPWARLVATALSRHPELIHGRKGPKTRLGGRKACLQTSLTSTWTDTGCATAKRRARDPRTGTLGRAGSHRTTGVQGSLAAGESEFARATGCWRRPRSAMACMGAALEIEPNCRRRAASCASSPVCAIPGGRAQGRHAAREAPVPRARQARRGPPHRHGREVGRWSIDELMASDEERATSVKGIGPISGAALAHARQDAKSAASLSCDSGNRDGARSRAGAGSCAGPCSWAVVRVAKELLPAAPVGREARRWRRWPWCASW